jgi:hypothetical protein
MNGKVWYSTTCIPLSTEGTRLGMTKTIMRKTIWGFKEQAFMTQSYMMMMMM